MKSHKQFQPFLRILGEKMYHQRILKNLVTKEFAPMVSLSPEAYRRIERGESDPSFTTILLITSKLDIDLPRLLKEHRHKDFMTPEKKNGKP